MRVCGLLFPLGQRPAEMPALGFPVLSLVAGKACQVVCT